MEKRERMLPRILLVAYLIFFTALGAHPYSRSVWIAENTPIVLIVVLLTVFYLRKIRFSNTAYVLMSVLVFMHTIGGHFTFERVPFEWFSRLLGTERNMYDRLAHFTVGFYAFGLMELADRRKIVNQKWFGYFASFCFIASVAAIYEVIEWIYAVTSDPASGNAFLGSQGDIWDAQKDMLLDMLGAIFALLIYFVRDLCCRRPTHGQPVGQAGTP